MKKIALLLFLAGMLAGTADDNFLRNGDFSSGVSHWDGDCHSPGSTAGGLDGDIPDLGGSKPAGATSAGVIIKLRPTEWTKMTQDFDGQQGQYMVKIAYTLSPGTQFSTKPEDYNDIPSHLGFSALGACSCAAGNWLVFINDLGSGHYDYWPVKPKDDPGSQSFSDSVNLESDKNIRKGFYLAFPPGTGTVTVQSVSLGR